MGRGHERSAASARGTTARKPVTRLVAGAAALLVAVGCAHTRAGVAAPGQEAAGVALRAPKGFRVNLFAENLGRARFMAFDPRGRLMVCDMGGGRVLTLPDENRDGRADKLLVFAEGLSLPHSLAWYKGEAYVACGTEVVKCTDADGNGIADRRQVVVRGLPDGPGHITRTIVLGPDGKMYISVGSSSNVSPEKDERRAAVLRFDADGSHPEVFATGLRNSVGLAFNPETGELWGTDNGRDYLGDDLPPDELNIIRRGGFYGWPWYYGDNVPDPAFTRRPPPGIPPALGFQAHSAPLGLCFYDPRVQAYSGPLNLFPDEYRGDVFVCFHGSWNRTMPTGYKVVRVRVRGGRPVSYEDFVTGFLTAEGATGRPVDVKVSPDGRSLYFSDDQGGRVYRVKYEGG